jgi:hypothetical protein
MVEPQTRLVVENGAASTSSARQPCSVPLGGEQRYFPYGFGGGASALRLAGVAGVVDVGEAF